MKWKIIPLLALFLIFDRPAFAFVLQTVRNRQGQVMTVHWSPSRVQFGIPYRVNTGSFPFPEADVRRVVQNSFGAWRAVETAQLRFQDQGTVGLQASVNDQQNVIVFDPTGRQIGAPRGVGVIAVTRMNWDEQGGIVDSDIVFNGRDFEFFANAQPPGPDRVDLQDVLTHEIGHFLGLDHTPLVGEPDLRPTMNPFNPAEAPGTARSLEPDDAAGISALYPSERAQETGTIAGQVRHLDGRGTFGVHVVAYRADTEVFVVSTLSGGVGDRMGPGGDGAYEISGLPPGAYHVAIEPLTGGVTYENFGGFFGQLFDRTLLREFYNNVVIQDEAEPVLVRAGVAASGIYFTLGTAVPEFPTIQEPVLPVNTPDTAGPYRVAARIRDEGGLAATEVVYEVNGGAPLVVPMQPEAGGVFAGAVPGFPSGTVVAYRIRARDVDGNETVLPPADQPMYRFEVLALSGQPMLYVVARRSGALLVIDTGLGKEVARIPTGGDTPLSTVLTPDGRYLFITNSGSDQGFPDNRVSVVEVATHRVVAMIPVGAGPLDLAVASDGARVYVSNSRDLSVSVLDVETLRETARLAVPTAGDGPFGIAVSRDGGRIFVTDIDGGRVFSLASETGQILWQADVVASPRSLALSADGNQLYVAGFNGGISALDAVTGKALAPIDTAPALGLFRVAAGPGGKRLYVTDPVDAGVLVVDLEQRRVTRVLSGPQGSRNSRDLVVSADGKRLYVTNQDSNDLLVFDTDSGQLVQAFKVNDGPRGIAVWAPPGRPEDVSGADFDGNGEVDFSDFLLLARGFGMSAPDDRFDARLDLDGNAQVGFADFLIFAGAFGQALNR